MKLLVISDPEFFPDEAEIINSLFREGLVCLHIRKPGSTETEFRKLLAKIEPGFMERTAIHQHHQLAGEFSIERLHFTENNRKLTSPEQFESLIKCGFKLSTSIHDLSEISKLSTLFSYTFFGPVFDSISKSGYKSALHDDFYLEAETRKIPIIALGGIDITNLKKIKQMNFDGAALLGTLWENPETAVRKFTDLKKLVAKPQSGAIPEPRVLHPGNINKLQFISNQTKDITHLESIELALDAGCRWIQLRVKDQSEETVLKTAIEVKVLCDSYDAKLIINDFPSIAKEIDAYGLHLGLNDMPIKSARKIVGNEMIIGGTANTMEDILNRIKESADYVGLGPFRFTSTKQKLSPIVGLEGYRQLLKSLKELGHSTPIIAIGGILNEDIFQILETGIHGVAMSGSIIGATNRKNLVYKINKILC